MKTLNKLFLILILQLGINNNSTSQIVCQDSVLTYIFDLSASDSMSVTLENIRFVPASYHNSDPNEYRCCASMSAGDNIFCIRFLVKLHPDADFLTFDMGGGWGSIDPDINACGVTFDPTQPLCINSATNEYEIIYCKQGRNPFDFTISSTNEIEASPDAVTSNGCEATIWANGLQEATINWNVVYPNSTYNAYLSSTSGTDSIRVSPPPDYKTIQYFDIEVTGTATSICNTVNSRDTVRVNFVTNKSVLITPLNPAICAGGSTARLTANVTNGLRPFTYKWYNMAGVVLSTDSFVDVGAPDNYKVLVQDATTCPPFEDTVTVIQYTLPIKALAGVDTFACGSIGTIQLNGAVKTVDSAFWSGGLGNFFPDSTTLNATYTPDATEIASGKTTLYLTTTNNGGCPASKDTLNILFFAESAFNVSATACNSYTFGGKTLTSSGTYTDTLVNYKGCDSIVTLNLTIVPPSIFTFNQTACNSFIYNSKTYTVSGTYTDTVGLNYLGCDSIVTINLTIKNSTTSTVNQTACDSYTLNGTTYNATGIYTQTVVNSVGCDSVITLNLTIVSSSPASVSISPASGELCEGGSITFTTTPTNGGAAPQYQWYVNNSPIALATSSSYSYSPANADAIKCILTSNKLCATGSPATSNIVNTLVHLKNNIVITSICQGDTYTLPKGTVVNVSGTYKDTLVNAFGCDSIITTILTVGTNLPTSISIAASQNPFCPGSEVTFTATPTNGGASPTYQWNVNTINVGLNTNAYKYFPNQGDIVKCSLTSSLACATGSPATSNSIFLNKIIVDTTHLNIAICPGSWHTLPDGMLVNIAGSYTSTIPSYQNCDSVILTNLSFIPAPTVTAGADDSTCYNLPFTVTLADTTNVLSVSWSQNGSGTLLGATTLTPEYYPSVTEVGTTIQLTVNVIGTGSCTSTSDVMNLKITGFASIEAGSNQVACANNSKIALSGNKLGAGLAQWRTSGNGTFSPSTTDLNAFYLAGSNDISSGQAILYLDFTSACGVLTDSILVTYTPSPIVNAGSDFLTCASSTSVKLNGQVTAGASTGIWKSETFGNFNPNNTSLVTYYLPNSADTASGSVKLILTSTNNGNCLAVSDTCLISFVKAPVTAITAPDTVCAGSAINLTIALTGGTGKGKWISNGSGTFMPHDSALVVIYNPSIADNAMNLLTFSFNIKPDAYCTPTIPTVNVVNLANPIVNAGADQNVCSNNATISLSANIVQGATKGIWSSSGTGIFSPSDTARNTSYIPSNLDTANKTLNITFSSTDGCISSSDFMKLDIYPAPVVNAGVPVYLCKGTTSYNLNGKIFGFTSSGVWKTLGNGSFNNTSLLNATYTFGNADTSINGVKLILTSLNNLDCKPVSDTLEIYFTTLPIVNAGGGGTICTNDSFPLNGTITSTFGTGKWTSDGGGHFSPSDSVLTAFYVPAFSDRLKPFVTATLTSTKSCSNSSSTTQIIVKEGPVISAGADFKRCESNTDIPLVAIGSAWAFPVNWSTSGGGTISPNASSTNIAFTPSAADRLAGKSTLLVATTLNGTCSPAKDTVIIWLEKTPTSTAGSDINICKNESTVLIGSYSGGNGKIKWSSLGDGTFSPSDTLPNTTYSPGTNDVVAGLAWIQLTSSVGGVCAPSVSSLKVTILPPATALAGPDQTVCSNNALVTLNGSVSNAPGGIWSAPGGGGFSPSSTSLAAVYSASSIDVSKSAFNIILSTTGGSCLSVTDTLQVAVTKQPTAFAGDDIYVCYGTQLVTILGNISGITNKGKWSTLGDGTFLDKDTILNNIYKLGTTDIANNAVKLVLTSRINGLCSEVTDTLLIQLTGIPTVLAGSDQTVCANNSNIFLSGQVTGTSGTGVWSTIGGTGKFSPTADSLQCIYLPSSDDTAMHSIKLVLTSTKVCVPVSDTITINFTPAPQVNAGVDFSACQTSSDVILQGKISGGASGGIWNTSSSGTFIPSNTALSCSYVFSATDKTNGFAKLALTSTGNGLCNAVTDSIDIKLIKVPVLTLTMPDTVCSGVTISIKATISEGNGKGKWSSVGGGIFTPNDSALNSSYLPSAIENTNGATNLVFTTKTDGYCSPVSETKSIVIKPSPIIDAGANQTVCANNSITSIKATITKGAKHGIWTSSGTGIFSPSDTSLTTKYLPSINDTSKHSVKLYFTTTDACNNVKDSLTLSITPAPEVEAGTTIFVCYGDILAQLHGSVSGGTTKGQWKTLGSGFFTNPTDFNASYVMSAADTAARRVTLVLTSTNNGNCIAVTDTVEVVMTGIPSVTANSDQTICANDTAALTGTISNNTRGRWTTSNGKGYFIPSDTAKTAYYVATLADTAKGVIKIFFSSTESCVTVSDSVLITINPTPRVSAGIDKSVCESSPIASFSANGSIWAFPVNWKTMGDGTFAPNNQSTTITYTVGTADITTGFARLVVTTTQNATCNPATDTVVLKIEKTPTSNAGTDFTICSGSTATISGVISDGSGKGKWSKGIGDGSFLSPDTLLSNVYQPGTNDIATGFVKLILASSPSGACAVARDTVKVNITAGPKAIAGLDASVCFNNGVVSLNGSVTNSAGSIWSAPGGGSFTPSNISLIATYNATSTDLSQNKFPIILTTTGNGLCSEHADSLWVTVLQPPSVNAGADKFVCVSTPTVDIAGAITGITTKGRWKTLGNGSFMAADTILSNWYKFGTNDIASSKVFLVLESRNNGSCSAVTDTIMIGITTIPTVNAGTNQTVCANNATTALNGTITGGSGSGSWSTPTGAGVFSPNSTNLSANYITAISDTSKHQIYIVLTATDACKDVTDTMLLNITPAPKVNAGIDQFFCTSASSIPLSGNVNAGAATGIWTTNGANSISNASNFSTNYSVHTSDTGKDSIWFVLTSTNNGNCLAEIDTSWTFFNSTPTANFAGPQYICQNTLIQLHDTSVLPHGKIISYNWNIDGTVYTDSVANHVFKTAGTSTIQYSITTDKGCTDNESRTVSVKSQPTATFISTPNCSSSPVQFIGSSPSATDWNWNFGNGETGNGKLPPIQNYPSSGDYDVELVIKDNFTCQDTINQVVKIFQNPVSQFTYDNVCFGSPTRFRNRTTIVGDAITGWNWKFGDGDTSIIKNPNHTYMTLQDSVKILLVAITAHCADTAIQAACVKGNPHIYASASEGCTPLTVTFSSDQPATSYFLWKFGDGFTSTQMAPSHQFINADDTARTFPVMLIAETEDGCLDTATFGISVKPKPKASMLYAKDKVCSNDSLSFTNTSTNTLNYKWYVNNSFRTSDSIVKFQFTNNSLSTQYQPVKLITYSSYGCADSIVKYATVFGIPVSTITPEKDTACNEESIRFDAPTGGATYTWDYGDSKTELGGASVFHAFKNVGTKDTTFTISLIYKSLELCLDTTTVKEVIRPTPTVSFTSDKTAGCTPLSISLINTTPGTVSQKWIFSDGDSVAQPSVNHIFTNTTLNQANGDVTLTITNIFGCTGKKSGTFNIYPQPSASFTNDSTGCTPFNIKFNNTSQNAASFNWDFGGGNTSTNENPIHTYLNETNSITTQYARLIAISTFGCRDTAQFNNIRVHPGPDGYFSLANSGGCSPFEAAFTNQSKGATSYKWIFGDSDTLSSLNTQVNHRYRNIDTSIIKYLAKLIPVNEFNCTDTVIQSIEVYPAIESVFSSDTIGCSPVKIKFTNGSKGSKYFNWLMGDGNTTTTKDPEHEYTNLENNPKTFIARLITISEYLCSDTSQKIIIIYPKPKATFSISPNSGCTPFNATLVDSTKNALKYFWDYGDGNTDTSNVFVRSHVYLNGKSSPQVYQLKLEVTAIGNCSDTLSHTVTVYPGVKASFDSDTAGCTPLSIHFSNTSDKVFKYSWDFGDGAVSGLEATSHTYINTSTIDTSYKTSLIAESHYGCADTVIKTYYVYAKPSPEFTAEPSYQVIPNSTVTFNNTTIGNWQYLWDFGDNQTSTDAQPGSHVYNKKGNYIIILKAFNAQCNDTAVHPIVIVDGKPTAAYDSAFSGCVPLTVTFINKSIGGEWYQWHFGDGGSSEDENPTYTYQQAGKYTVELIAKSPTGETVANDKMVTVHPKPRPYFQIAPAAVDAYKEMKCYNNSSNASRYKWEFGDGGESEDESPTHIYTKEGKYNIKLYTWSEFNCFDTIVVKDAINVLPACGILFPNAFTPSKSGPSGGKYNPDEKETTNDIFHPITKNITGYELEIFSRWGELIFKSNDISVGWDGYFREILVKDDVYIWKVKATCFNGREIVKTGTVIVVL